MDLDSMKKVWEAYLEVTEKKLSPAQKKHLDQDKDGDIDGQDFAALRAKKAKKTDEGSCGSHRKTKQEGKMECPKCKGEGCDHCDGKGYHMSEEKIDEAGCADDIKQAPTRKGDNRNGEKSISKVPPEGAIYKEFVEVLERAIAPADKQHTKGATPTETMDDKIKGKAAKDFVKKHEIDKSFSDFEEKGHQDAADAGRATSHSKPRRGDNLKNGDGTTPKKVVDNS